MIEYIKEVETSTPPLNGNPCSHKFKSGVHARGGKPNIIFYFADQQRHDTMGCYGQKLDVTPNLDKLALEGTRFENAFTCQPVCGPARASLQSGLYPTEVNCYKNGISLPRNIKTVADYFDEADYETAYVGKWHLASDYLGEDHTITAIPQERRGGYKDFWMAADVLEFTSHGYDGFVFDKDNKKHEFIGYRADAINNYAINYVQNKTSDKPFFMFISQIEPHHQNDRNRYEGPDGSKEKFKNYEVPMDLVGTEGDWRENFPDYLGQCHSLDENVGRLVATLKDKGEWDNTILFYTSDHGSHFRTRNSEYKRACHDGCTHIPMIAVGGAFDGGKTVKNLASLMDIPRTLLECAGIEVPENFQGQSLLNLVNEPENDTRKVVFIQLSESQTGRAIRTERYTYSVIADKNDVIDGSYAEVYHEDFLYDNQTDPQQHNNLIGKAEFRALADELKAMLLQEIENANEAKASIINA